jgi:hypothetical protein
MMELDIKYAREKTLWMDLAIIVKTPLVVIGQVLESRQRKSGGTPPGIPSRPSALGANFSREKKSPKLTAETQMN